MTEPVDIALGDLGASLDGKDCPHVHRLVLVPDCLRVAYAAEKSGRFRKYPILTNFILDFACFHLWDMMAVLM